VLAGTAASGVAVRATLVELDPELDPELASAARATARELRLDVDVRRADAGGSSPFSDVLPVDALLLCGIFGNIIDADVAATVAALPCLLAPEALVCGPAARGSTSTRPTSTATRACTCATCS